LGGNENVNIVFCAYFRQMWIDLRQTKSSMICGPFYTYHQLHFVSGNVSFYDNL